MVSDAMRTHVVLSRKLVEEIDEIAGQRKRSEYIEQAVREKVMRDRRLAAFDAAVGSLADVDVPGWETPEAASEWVRTIRRASDRRIENWSEGLPNPRHENREDQKMFGKTVRTHVVLPEDLVEELDRIAGPRRRSEFIAEVVEKELRLRRWAELARELMGSLAGPGKHIPEWDTPESTERWIREGRRDRRDPWYDATNADRS